MYYEMYFKNIFILICTLYWLYKMLWLKVVCKIALIYCVNALNISFRYIQSNVNTVEPHLSGPHLSVLITYPDTFGNQSPFLNIKCLTVTYLEIRLSRQSVWERRCPDKWSSTVYTCTCTLIFVHCTLFLKC